MAHPGYFVFGGTEIINAERTAAYIKNLVPQLKFTHTRQASCPDLRYLVNRAARGEVINGVVQPQSGAYIEESSRYTTPILDHPEWYDPDNPDTWDFCGLYPLKVDGLENDTRSATVQQNSLDGGAVLRPRRATREVRFSGLLVARTDAGLSAGRRWLRKSLDGSGCGTTGDCGEGDQLCFFTACPDCAPMEGMDYLGTPEPFYVPGAYGWRAVGGTYTRNTGTGVGTYTSAVAGTSYVEYSPFAAVCDDMTFRANFSGIDLTALVKRTNMVLNPSYRASSGTTTVRTNLINNPVGKYNVNYWRVKASNALRAHVEARGPTTTSSPNGAGRPGYQDRYLMLEVDNTITRANAGITTTIDLQSLAPLYVECLAKCNISGVNATKIAVDFLDETYNIVNTQVTSDFVMSLNVWRTLAATFTPPATSVMANIHIYVSPSVTGNFSGDDNAIYVSEVLAEHASSIPNLYGAGVTRAYFDGDINPGKLASPGTGLTRKWAAGVHASPSMIVGPGLPNTLVGVPSNNVNSYRAGTDFSYVYAMALSSGNVNTVKVLESPALTLIPGATRYAVRVRAQHIEGPTTGYLVLRLRAYNAANASLGVIATTTDTQFQLVNKGAAVDVLAPSTATLPVGTTYIKAEAWYNTTSGSAVPPNILMIRDFLVENVATATVPGTFFDGETADVPGVTLYDWTGQPNYSTSQAKDPVETLAKGIRIEAWGDTGSGLLDTKIASYDTSVLHGSAELTVDGSPWQNIAWRLIPLTTDALSIANVAYQWRLNYDYSNVFSNINMHPLGYYTAAPPNGTYDATADPVVDMLESVTQKYFRTVRNVTTVAGPVVTDTFASTKAYMAKVEFTMVAGVPWLYSDEIDVGTMDLSVAAQQFSLPTDDQFLMSDIIPQCERQDHADPVIDPACAVIPEPPTVPAIMAVCGPTNATVTNRYAFRIPASAIPEWGDVVPIIEYTPVSPTAQARILFYPTPVPGQMPADLDPCSLCAALTITYSDTNGIVVNGAEETVYSPMAEMGTDENGASYETGRYINRPAKHLITSEDFGPFEWPKLSCGIGYLMVVETFDDVAATISLRLAGRQ